MKRGVVARAGAVACAQLLALAMGLASASAATLQVDGEVYARDSDALLPPAIDGMWQFNITRLAPDGSPVEKGQVVLSFDGGTLMKRLTEKNSLLAEQQRQLEKLLLELAERERTERLSTAEARANLEKARRKTAQPQALMPGIEYRKLMVARGLAEERMSLAQRREVLAAGQRRQERRLLESEVAQLQREVAELQRSLAALDVVAPRAGLMMHESSWSGEKYDVGSQVWRGQAVGEIPDLSTLAVRAELPERDLSRVEVGAPARVVVEGGAGITVRGRVRGIGRAVRSKSRVQPVPVLDLEIVLDDPGAPLKPGQAVRVEVTVADTGEPPA